jgi:hypothetical protein
MVLKIERVIEHHADQFLFLQGGLAGLVKGDKREKFGFTAFFSGFIAIRLKVKGGGLAF